MIKNLLLKVSGFVLTGLLLISCKSSYITVDVLQPARIDIPSEIKSVAILNRSLPAKEERAMNVIEGVFSGEGLFNDRMGSEQCVIGTVDLLNNSPRFKAILPKDIDIRGTGTDRFPLPLEWQYIRDICNMYNVDALITLETFDSDSHIDYDRNEYTREEDGKKIKYVEYEAELYMEIEAGWRIYYANREAIIDENVYYDNMSWEAKGVNEKDAKNNLPPNSDIIQQAGFFAGQQYAARISPVWITVSRNFYSKGNEELEKAARYAKQGNWNEAADIWNNIINSDDKTIAGYAAYNLALACEMKGELKTALEWIEKSFFEYGNKKAKNYINIIKGRIADQGRLDKQLKD